MNKIAIIGASGHGKVVADIAHLSGYDEIVFLDDNPHKKNCGRYPVIGKTQDFNLMDCDVFVAIGNEEIRNRMQDEIEKKGKNSIPVLIHPNATVAEGVTIGNGTVIMAGAIIPRAPPVGIGNENKKRMRPRPYPSLRSVRRTC